MENFLFQKGLDFCSYTRDEHIMLNYITYLSDEETHQFTFEEKVRLMMKIGEHSYNSGVKLDLCEFRMFHNILRKSKLNMIGVVMYCFYSVNPNEFNVDEVMENFRLLREEKMKEREMEF